MVRKIVTVDGETKAFPDTVINASNLVKSVDGIKGDVSLSSTYVAPDKIAPAATGVAGTGTANLQAAIDATPRGRHPNVPALWTPQG